MRRNNSFINSQYSRHNLDLRISLEEINSIIKFCVNLTLCNILRQDFKFRQALVNLWLCKPQQSARHGLRSRTSQGQGNSINSPADETLGDVADQNVELEEDNIVTADTSV